MLLTLTRLSLLVLWTLQLYSNLVPCRLFSRTFQLMFKNKVLMKFLEKSNIWLNISYSFIIMCRQEINHFAMQTQQYINWIHIVVCRWPVDSINNFRAFKTLKIIASNSHWTESIYQTYKYNQSWQTALEDTIWRGC